MKPMSFVRCRRRCVSTLRSASSFRLRLRSSRDETKRHADPQSRRVAQASRPRPTAAAARDQARGSDHARGCQLAAADLAAARPARADKRLGRRLVRPAAAPSRATQAMSGAGCASTGTAGRVRRPRAASIPAALPTDAARRIARRRAPPRSARRRGVISVPPSPPEDLQVDVVVPRIDRGRSPDAVSSSAMNGAAEAASVARPTTGLPAASAIPRAAEMPTRNPVKLPGPVVTAMRSSAAKAMSARVHHAAISGIRASA